MGPISPFVIIWTVLALLGLALTIPAFITARRDDANVREGASATTEQRIASRAAVRNAVGRVVVNGFFVAVGVETLTSELGWRLPDFSVVFAWQLIAALAVLDVLSMVDWLQRSQIVRAYESRQAALARVAAMAASAHEEVMTTLGALADTEADTNRRIQDVQRKIDPAPEEEKEHTP